MKIENLRSERVENKARAVATVVWEDKERPNQDIVFETDEAFAEHLICNPHAFLVACVLPAMRHSEQRVAIDETICPELRNGLETAMEWICHWYGPPRQPVQLETKAGIRSASPRHAERAGAFLSGGVDSLAMLRANRLDFAPNHPRSIKEGLLVHGFDIGGREGGDTEIQLFNRAATSLKPVAKDAGVTLVPVRTNVRHLEDDVYFWIYEFHGAALASVAHALSNRLTLVSIASTYDIPNLAPWGSHPLLDPNYASTNLRIQHDGVRLSRLEKTRIVSDWDVALENLRVCTMPPPPGMLNCGKCEKCVRTMTELLAIDKLAHAKTFPVDDVSEELLGSLRITTGYQDSCYRELISPLRVVGRRDLAEIIRAKSAEFHKRIAWEEERDWKGAVKRFDRKYLGESLFNTYRTFRQGAKSQYASPDTDQGPEAEPSPEQVSK